MTDGWEPRPLPVVTPETAGYWRGAAEGRLRLSRCRACELTYHYPRAHCPDCFSDDVEWIGADGTGTVYSYAVPERIEGWPDEHRPLVVAHVELTEGPRLVTNVVACEPETLSIGDRVEVRFVPTERDEVAIPVFERVE